MPLRPLSSLSHSFFIITLPLQTFCHHFFFHPLSCLSVSSPPFSSSPPRRVRLRHWDQGPGTQYLPPCHAVRRPPPWLCCVDTLILSTTPHKIGIVWIVDRCVTVCVCRHAHNQLCLLSDEHVSVVRCVVQYVWIVFMPVLWELLSKGLWVFFQDTWRDQ